jgi:hypothetical protein
MTRALYRVYLYVVCLALLGFTALRVGVLLSDWLLLSPLRGLYESAPDRPTLTQAVVLAVVALVLSGLIGGFHYWLIRRDIALEGQAALGAVRSAALNLALAVSAVVAFFTGAITLGQIGRPIYSGTAVSMAAALTALGTFALVEWERRRGLPRPGAARTLQRLHYYLIQTIVLLAAISFWQQAVHSTLVAIFSALHLLGTPCPQSPGPYTEIGPCYTMEPVLGPWLAVVWLVCFWAYYFVVARDDTDSILRLVAQFFGFMIGTIATLFGLYQLADVLLRAVLGVAPLGADDIANQHEFLPPLLFGLIVAAGYVVWLLSAAERTRLSRAATELTVLALGAIAVGVPFYLGVYTLLTHAVEGAVGKHVTSDAWAGALALLLAGVVHPPLALVLRQRTSGTAPIGPRRGLVFAGRR